MTPALSLLLAAPGLPGEAALVAACQRRGSTVVISRRCVDAVDLIGAGASGAARIAVVGPELPRLTREVIARLEASGLSVVGVVAEGDEEGERFLRRLEVTEVLPLRISPIGADVDGAVRALAEALRAHVDLGASDPTRECRTSLGDGGPGTDEPGQPGRLVAVWGPTGAPGRTSVAIGLADEAARSGIPALLVDADTYGGAMATLLGIWDEASGVALACRRAETGHLDVPALAECARQIGPDLRILSGLVHADRWPELRASALRRVWETCRATPGLTIVDTGFCLESDEDGVLSRRHATALTAVAAADLVVAVGSADPIGLGRLVAALPEAREVIGDTPLIVAITRVHSGTIGRDPQRQVREVLAELGDIHDDLVLIPDDRAAFDACAREGRTLAELAAGSTARAAQRGLATLVTDRLAVTPVTAGDRGRTPRFRRRSARDVERMTGSRVSA